MTHSHPEQTVLTIHRDGSDLATIHAFFTSLYEVLLERGLSFNRFYLDRRLMKSADLKSALMSNYGQELGAAHHNSRSGVTSCSVLIKPMKLILLVPGDIQAQLELIWQASLLTEEFWNAIYGYAYAMRTDYCPMLYALNLPYHPTPDAPEARYLQSQRDFERWINHEENADIVARGLFRSWYPINLLGSVHVKRLNALGKLHDLIVDSSRIQLLSPNSPTTVVATDSSTVEIKSHLEQVGLLSD